MNTSKRSGKLLHNTRGAIMVEGIIVLPLFVITLASVIYFHSLYAAKLDMSRKARACAWEYSVRGCKPGLRPKKCNATDMQGSDQYETVGSKMTGGNPFDVKDSGSASQKRAQTKSGLDKGLEGASSVGLALIGLDKGITTSNATDVKRPSILGGGKRRVTSNYSVMCNEVEMKPFDIAKDALCALGKTMGFEGCEKK